MKQETLKHLADGTSALAVSTGIGNSAFVYWDFINKNAAGIGVILSVFFGLIAIGFNIYNARKSRLSSENEKEIEKLKKQLAAIGARDSDKLKDKG